MPVWMQLTSTFICTLAASSGFWAYLSERRRRKEAESNRNSMLEQAVLGLLHDRLMIQGQKYIDAGEITLDDYNDFFKYLYDPYYALGGNGTGERLALAVKNLPIKG